MSGMKDRKNGAQKTLHSKLSFGLPIIALLLFLPFAAADFTDGFDNYAPGTVSPYSAGSPWTQTISPGYSSCFATSNVISSSHALSTSNVYALHGANNATCFTGSHSVTVSALLNGSVPSGVTLTLYWYVAQAPGSNSTYTLTASLCGTSTSTNALDHATGYWQKISLNATLSSPCTLSFALSTVNAASASVANILIDNIKVKGANVEISPYDVTLIDLHTRLPFNITQYAGSRIVVNYTTTATCTAPVVQLSPTSCGVNNLFTSYIQIPLTSANLLTVYVGNSYVRTLIPTSTTHQVVYLDPASTIITYQITVTDLSSRFPTESQVSISVGGVIVTSGYLDVASGYSAALQPGTYTFKLVNGPYSFATLINFGANTAIPVQITKFATSASPGQIASTTTDVNWGCDQVSIIGYYSDTTSSTTKVVFNLYNQSASGTFLVGSITVSGTIGLSQATFTGINKSQGTYLILFTATNAGGTFNLGPRYVSIGNPSCPAAFPGLLPALPSFPVAVFGLDQILPNANGFSELLGLTLLILTAGIFGARYGQIGFVVLAFEAMWLFLALFIPSTYTLLYLLLISSVIGFMIYRKRRPL